MCDGKLDVYDRGRYRRHVVRNYVITAFLEEVALLQTLSRNGSVKIEMSECETELYFSNLNWRHWG